MIYNFIAYCPTQAAGSSKGNFPWLGKDAERAINLGWTYNQYMELLPNEDDWACFLDHDAMYTTHNWYNQLESIIEKYPDYGLFTSKTNRISNGAQITYGVGKHIHDMKFHRAKGYELQEEYFDLVTEMPRTISGVVMLTKKAVWKAAGGFKDGFLGVDSNYDGRVRAAGYKVGLMEGVFVYHWYREKVAHLEKTDPPANVGNAEKKPDKATATNETIAPKPSLKPLPLVDKITSPHQITNRTHLVNYLIQEAGYASYLEIGVDHPGKHFDKVNCSNKVGVDPAGRCDHVMTSDAYFDIYDDKFDLIFIDGLHTEVQVMKDIQNAQERLNEGGTIVVHDCNPASRYLQRPYEEYQAKGGPWTGTVWKAIAELRMTRDDLEVFVVDMDYGVGIIRKGSQQLFEPKTKNPELTYDFLVENRNELLHLHTAEQFMENVRQILTQKA